MKVQLIFVGEINMNSNQVWRKCGDYEPLFIHFVRIETFFRLVFMQKIFSCGDIINHSEWNLFFTSSKKYILYYHPSLIFLYAHSYEAFIEIILFLYYTMGFYYMNDFPKLHYQMWNIFNVVYCDEFIKLTIICCIQKSIEHYQIIKYNYHH